MRSFALALIAAALAPLASAAPVSPVSGVSPPTLGQVSSVEGKVKSVEENVHAHNTKTTVSNAVDGLEDKIHGFNARADTPSVAAIFSGLSTEIAPYVQELSHIDSSSASVARVTDLVASIKAPIAKAVPELHALVGAEASIVLAPVSGIVAAVELTVSDVAGIVGSEVKVILAGAGGVLTVVEAHVPAILSDVEDVLADLGATVTDLVVAVVDLVEGVAAPLVVELQPVVAVIGELHLTGLASSLGILL